MPATEHAFSELPSSQICLDTDFILNYLFAQQPHHDRTEAFVLRLYEYNQTVICISSLTWMEYAHVVAREDFRRNLPEAVRRRFGLNRWQDAAVRRGYMDQQLGVLSQFLEQFAWAEIPLTPSIREDAPDLMKTYNLDAHDNVQLASARSAGVGDLASFDRVFRRVDDLDLWNDRVHGGAPIPS